MSDDDILKEAREAFELAAEREAKNREEALDDIKFARLEEQWPEEVRVAREREGRPCLTASRLGPTIRQVVNDARQNKPQIKVQPQDSNADPLTAEIMSGLIRNIEVSSDADAAYDIAVDSAVTCGFGYFRINTDYACDDTFDQDIVIQAVPNPFSVYGDPYSQKWDSSDWNSAFVVDTMPKTIFQRRFKGAEEVDWDHSGYVGLGAPWVDGDEIMIAEYWSREQVTRKVVALSTGEVVGLDEFQGNLPMFQALGVEIVGSPRPVKSHKVTQRLLTGAEVIETVDWAGKYIPIVPVYGDEVNVEGVRHFRSLIRPAKDMQRMLNYHHTMMTELISLAPKAPYIGKKGAFKTDAAKWSSANSVSHSYIEYDGEVPPQRQPFAGTPVGDMQAMMVASDQIKAVTGIYDASLGNRSNEISGRAILARQREGDVSTFHFIDNLTRAIRHGGRILVDLIPKVYSTERVVRVLGPEGEAQNVPLKTPLMINGVERIFDLSAGRYDLTVSAGPSFTTRREESAVQMTELIRAYPAAAPILADLLAKNLDWPGADEIAKRLNMLLPPEVREGEGGEGAAPDPAAQEAQAAVQALQQQVMALSQQLQATMADKSLDQRKLEIEAFKAGTDRIKANAEAEQAAQRLLNPSFADGHTGA